MAPPVPALPALIVSYSFPPVGGAGVQRMAKLVKYLPHHGVSPTVLTVKNPSVPVTDETLAADLPRDLAVVRTRTFEPGYGLKQAAWSAAASAPGPARDGWRRRLTRTLSRAARQVLVPDPQVLWQPTAMAAALGRLLMGRDRAVLISGPPFSQFLLAPLLRLRPGTGVVLDYRDEWSTYRTTYEMMGSRLAVALGEPLEQALLRRAHLITTATEEFRQDLLRRFSFLDPGRVRTIENGYDPDDFPAPLPEPPADRFVLSYAGTLFKMTSARGLLGAIRRLHREEPALARLLHVRFMGRIVDTELDAFAGTEGLGVERLGYLDHQRVLAELARSHLVLCLLDEVPGAERIYPGKIFELMYLGRPCLVLAPEGALTRLSVRHRLGAVRPPRDEAAIAALLAAELRRFQAGDRPPRADAVDIGRYHRRVLAGCFASVLQEAAAVAQANA